MKSGNSVPFHNFVVTAVEYGGVGGCFVLAAGEPRL
jgi:hypothetical protein